MSFEAKDYCVLVVDDEVDYAEITARMLGIEGFKTIVAHSGKQAIEALKGQHIDAIISDVRMPEGDGLSVLESVKAGSFGHVKAFAFITGFSDYPTEELLKKGGRHPVP